jgi:hypothetical protein
MVLITSLLLSAFAILTTASPLLPRDASPEDSITYCSTPDPASCSSTPDPLSAEVVILPAAWYGHFECYATVDGVYVYYSYPR